MYCLLFFFELVVKRKINSISFEQLDLLDFKKKIWKILLYDFKIRMRERGETNFN